MLPAKQISSDVISRFKHLTLADPTFDTPSPTDVLLGADVFPQLLIQNSFDTNTGNPSAISTQFGWVILGPLENDETYADPISLHMSCAISAQLQNFWAIEEIPTPYISKPDDDGVEEHFSTTHTRNSDGRYVVSLPFKPGAPALTVNACSPIHALNRLESKLSKIPSQFSSYNEFMREYLKPAAYVERYYLREIYNSSSRGLENSARLVQNKSCI